MDHTENAYAAMLLTMALSPDREEYARPLSTPEFRRVEALARSSSFGSIGALLDVDISGLVMLLGLTEEEAYRVYTLLHRDVQLTYTLGGFMEDGIEVVTQYDAEYPSRLNRMLKESTPPFLYRCGNGALPDQPAIAVMGISGVRTTPEARRQIEILVEDDGRGIDTDLVDSMNKQLAGDVDIEKLGFGLVNVNQRVKLMYGTQYGLTIDSGSKGVRVSIFLPEDLK